MNLDMQETHDVRAGRWEGVFRHPVPRWLLHRWFLLTRAMTMGVRAIVIDDEERVLLVRHTYVPGWHLPGGGVDIGETLIDALARELREETGVELRGPAALHGIFLNREMAGRDHVAAFVVRDFAWSGPPQASGEISAARFFALSALPGDTTGATRARLAEIAADLAPSAYW